MKRFNLTEDEKKQIRGLYENTPSVTPTRPVADNTRVAQPNKAVADNTRVQMNKPKEMKEQTPAPAVADNTRVAQPNVERLAQPNKEVRLTPEFNSLMNFLNANRLITYKRDRRGGNIILVGREDDQSNHLMDLIGKLTGNMYTDWVMAWVNQNMPNKGIQHVKITNEQFS